MNHISLASPDLVEKVIANLAPRGIQAISVATGADALEKIKEYIPAGASIMNGASRTLEQIGFVEYLKSGQHPWNNLHAAIITEQDKAKQAELRKQALLSDYYLGSVHALTQSGELLIASNTGSQLPHIVFSSQNIIFVVSAKKITPTFDEALARLEKHVIPLEDERMHQVYGIGTALNKLLIFKGESPMIGRKVRMILVQEDLGF